jgi:hypothetical protein
MNIQQYLEKVNVNTQEIYSKTIQESDKLGYTHHVSSFISEFSEFLFDNNEKELLQTVAVQLEMATLNLVYGMYRQAFSSLRLAFELGLGVIHFSVYKLEHNEWINGENDIIWSKLIDEENGVISKRFSKAFFPELISLMGGYNKKAKNIYRKMSEFVHGNNETWIRSGSKMEYNEKLKNEYFERFEAVSEILIFILCCRYLKLFKPQDLESLSTFLLEEMKQIAPIREFLGGVKEL